MNAAKFVNNANISCYFRCKNRKELTVIGSRPHSKADAGDKRYETVCLSS